MTYDVRLTSVTAVPLAAVRLVAPQSQLSTVVPASCGVVWKFVKAHGLRGGRNVAVYRDDAINLDVGVELEDTFEPSGEIVASATPAGLAATVTHFGPYGRMGAAHEAIRQWCHEHGHRLKGPNWQVYGHWMEAWNANPALIRTDIFYLVDSAGA